MFCLTRLDKIPTSTTGRHGITTIVFLYFLESLYCSVVHSQTAPAVGLENLSWRPWEMEGGTEERNRRKKGLAPLHLVFCSPSRSMGSRLEGKCPSFDSDWEKTNRLGTGVTWDRWRITPRKNTVHGQEGREGLSKMYILIPGCAILICFLIYKLSGEVNHSQWCVPDYLYC